MKKIRPPRTPEALDKLIAEFVRHHDAIAREQARLDTQFEQLIARSVKRASKYVREIIPIATAIDTAFRENAKRLMGDKASVRLPHGKITRRPAKGIVVGDPAGAIKELRRLKQRKNISPTIRRRINDCIRVIEEVDRTQLKKHPQILSLMKCAWLDERIHVLITPKGRTESINLRKGLTLRGPC